MKEIISAVLLLVSIVGGGVALKNLHDIVRKAALEKASQGLPSLSEISRNLQAPRSKKKAK